MTQQISYTTLRGMNTFECFVKRSVDILLSLGSLVLFALPIAIIYIAVKWEDGGPAIFKQERMGMNGKPFMLYKFRSMRTDAEKNNSPQLYSEGDSRLTKVGDFIRTHHIDEFPQLWNILIGDMSFVGYRPERQFYIDQIMEHCPQYVDLYQMRPGIFSLATLYNGYTDTIEKMITRTEMDLEYLRKGSLWLDIKIIFLTSVAIITGKKF